MCRRLLPLILIVTLLLLLLPAAAQAISFDQAVNKLISSGWAKKMETKCVSFKGNAMGFRSAGTPADDACARWIATQMRLLGLRNVRLEAVPVDEWDFKSASVTVSGGSYAAPVAYRASSFGGCVPTKMGGAVGDVVYVKDVDLMNGPWSGSAGAFDAVGDVAGKVVVVDFESSMWWMSLVDMEAGLRDAAAVILTYSSDWPGYFGQEDALACFDAETDLSAPPMVWLAKKDGDALKAALAGGPVSATVKNNVVLRLAADGGSGYNVVGSIPGTTNKSEYVIFGGHHDAWFKGGLDNASSVVDQLVIAKAMKMSGVKPKRTMVFLSTTAEEYGVTNSWYDWCIGAWHFITQRHPSWSGRIAGMLNAEILGYKNGNLWMLASPEVKPMLEDQLAVAATRGLQLTKNDTDPAVIGDPWCWNDQWTFSAAGVPSVSFWSQDNDYSGVYKTTIYHTQYDTPSLIDWTYFGDIVKFQFQVTKKFDRGLLPYTLTERANQLLAALQTQIGPPDPEDPEAAPTAPAVWEVIEKSVEPDVSTDFTAAATRFDDASRAYDDYAAGGYLPAANLSAINAQLIKIEKLVNANFTALDSLDNTVYPFDQVARDIYHLQAAYDALDSVDPDYDGAAAEIATTGLMWYGTNFSRPVFREILQQHRPSYYNVCWGAQGHQPRYQDNTPEYEAILAGDQTTALDLIQSRLDVQEADLQARIVDMTSVLDEAAAQIEDLFPVMAMIR